MQQRLLPSLAPDRRVLGIIRPSVEALAGDEACRTVALWATPGTVSSDSYALELAKLRPGLRLVQVACPLLVPLVENGELAGDGLDYFVRQYWAQTEASAGGSVDALLLACTHYPLLLPAIRAVVPPARPRAVAGRDRRAEPRGLPASATPRSSPGSRAGARPSS